MAIPLTGTFTINPLNIYNVFGRYEKNKVMVAAEYSRLPATVPIVLTSALTGTIPDTVKTDQRSWYGMASYKVTNKFTAGIYHSQLFDHASSLGPGRFSKDWALNAHYDFNEFLYAKAEQHFIDGTGANVDPAMNPHGEKPDSRLTVLKIGVNF